MESSSRFGSQSNILLLTSPSAETVALDTTAVNRSRASQRGIRLWLLKTLNAPESSSRVISGVLTEQSRAPAGLATCRESSNVYVIGAVGSPPQRRTTHGL